MPPPDAETVQVIPGSELIWKITPRPGNSAKVRPVNEAGIMGRILLASLKNSVLSSLQQFYAFSTFAMQLNALEKSMEGVIAPTDSRLRPDIRALENGDIGTLCGSDTAGSGSCSHWVPERTTACVDLASAEKKRLEEKQRMARKNRSKSTDEWKTRQVDPTRPVVLRWRFIDSVLIVAALLSCLPPARLPLTPD